MVCLSSLSTQQSNGGIERRSGKRRNWTTKDLQHLAKYYGIPPMQELADRFEVSVRALQECCRRNRIKALPNKWAGYEYTGEESTERYASKGAGE